MYSQHNPYSYAFLSTWHKFTKDSLGFQWRLWGTFDLNNNVHFSDSLEKKGNKFS